MDCIPYEVFQYILSFLPAVPYLYRFCTVNKTWFELSKRCRNDDCHEFIWKEEGQKYHKEDFEKYLKIAMEFKNIKRLILYNMKYNAEIAKKISNVMPNVKELVFIGCYILPSFSYEKINNTDNHYLSNLGLTKNGMPSSWINSVESITFFTTRIITDYGQDKALDLYISICDTLTNLKSLDLSVINEKSILTKVESYDKSALYNFFMHCAYYQKSIYDTIEVLKLNGQFPEEISKKHKVDMVHPLISSFGLNEDDIHLLPNYPKKNFLSSYDPFFGFQSEFPVDSDFYQKHYIPLLMKQSPDTRHQFWFKYLAEKIKVSPTRVAQLCNQYYRYEKNSLSKEMHDGIIIHKQDEYALSFDITAILMIQFVRKHPFFGIDTNLVDGANRTIFHYATIFFSPEVLLFLLRYEIMYIYEVLNVNGETNPEKETKHRKEHHNHLIENLKRIDSTGSTIIELGAKKKHANHLKVLLRYGISINSQNKDGNTALHNLCIFGQSEKIEKISKICKELSQCQPSFCNGFQKFELPDPTIQNSDGNTCFHLAAEGNNKNTYQLLEKLFPNHTKKAEKMKNKKGLKPRECFPGGDPNQSSSRAITSAETVSNPKREKETSSNTTKSCSIS